MPLPLMPVEPREPTPQATDPEDAIALIAAHHAAVSCLFEDYATARSVAQKQGLVAEICRVLIVHAQVQEEIFYPALKAALNGKWQACEARIKATDCKALVAQLHGAEPDSAQYEHQVDALLACVKHHVQEELDGLFPQAASVCLDLIELGDRMSARKDDLLAQAA